jgi:serine/threonine-protein kinase
VADISESLPAGSLAPGSTVAGYVIEERIGAGGMAVVYRARDDVLGRLVAVKVLASALADDEEFRVRFMRESRAIAAVNEPHIVPVYGAGNAGGLLYIATKFVADGDLSRLQDAADGQLPPDRAADLVAQVAGALDAAHAIGLVHRDVKPANILVERIPGRPEHAYLSDFGLSKSTAAGESGLTAAGLFMGTPDYSAPEQITGGRVDGRTDQYSLACVAFSLLAGTAPFGSGDALSRLYAHVNAPVPTLTAVRPELPAAVDEVLAKGMAKDPADRYESCAAFALALGEALGIQTGAPRPGRASARRRSGPGPRPARPGPAGGRGASADRHRRGTAAAPVASARPRRADPRRADPRRPGPHGPGSSRPPAEHRPARGRGRGGGDLAGGRGHRRRHAVRPALPDRWRGADRAGEFRSSRRLAPGRGDQHRDRDAGRPAHRARRRADELGVLQRRRHLRQRRQHQGRFLRIQHGVDEARAEVFRSGRAGVPVVLLSR